MDNYSTVTTSALSCFNLPGYIGNFAVSSGHLALHLCFNLFRFRFANNSRRSCAPIWRISGFLHSARGQRRRPDADARGDERFVRIERNGVFIDRDMHVYQALFPPLCRLFPCRP